MKVFKKALIKLFLTILAQSSKDIKRAWSSNNVNGCILLVDALLQTEKKKYLGFRY